MPKVDRGLWIFMNERQGLTNGVLNRLGGFENMISGYDYHIGCSIKFGQHRSRQPDRSGGIPHHRSAMTFWAGIRRDSL